MVLSSVTKSRESHHGSLILKKFPVMAPSLAMESTIRDNWSEFEEKAAVNNISVLMDNNPEALDGTALFSHFHELWNNSPTSPIDLPLQYSYACATIAKRLPMVSTHLVARDGLPNIRSLHEMLTMEKDTWTLISALYMDRLEAENQMGTTTLDSYSSVHHSEREIVKLLYEKDSQLREMQMLIDWLERRVREHIEEVAERYECLFNQTMTCENTAHMLDYLPETEIKSQRLITELHPDAVSCTGRRLDARDQTDNDRFLNYLFLCIRGGDLQRAHRLCMQRGEFWRAVSLEGWHLFHFSGFVTNQTSDHLADQMELDRSGAATGAADMDEDTESQSESGVWDQTRVTRPNAPVSGPCTTDPDPEGNATRILYKSVCWWNAEDTRLHKYDRAIYASLSGNLGVLQRTLPASWTDLLWAHCRAAVEARVDSSLRHLLHTGPRANTLAVTGKTNTRWPLDAALSLPAIAWLPKDWTIGETFDRVESTLGWSALGYLQKSSTSIALDTVRRSALNDFILGDGSQTVLTNPMYDRSSGKEPVSVTVLLYCLFYATQQAVMLRDYDTYLSALADLMPQLVKIGLGLAVPPEMSPLNTLNPPEDVNPSTKNVLACQALRFLAHFVLFLRAAEPNIPEDPCAEIIKAYLYLLMADRRTELIANYTATLPTTALRIQWYSSFLADITQAAEREHCLHLAVSAGFDVQRLTRAVVRLLRQRQPLLPFQPRSFGDTRSGACRHPALVDSVQGAELAAMLQEEKLGKLTEVDRMRIISMDWLFFDPKQRGEALVVANSLLRVFVAMNCLKAAQQVLAKLPPGTKGQAQLICENLGSPYWLVNAIREHECLVLYLDSQDAFADWFKQVHANRPAPPPESNTSSVSSYGARGFAQRLQAEEAKKAYEARLERWRHELRLDTEMAAEKLLQLLTFPSPGWLVDFDDNAISSGRCRTNTPAPGHGDDQGGESASAIGAEDEDADAEEAVDATGDGELHRRTESAVLSNGAAHSGGDLTGLGENPEARRLQMQVLRETCLTETCFLLVRLYQTAGMHEHCLELASLIASEQHGLHKLFSKAQLQKLLDQITESIEHVMTSDGDPLGYPTLQADHRPTDCSINGNN